MKFLPSENLEFRTALKEYEVFKRIEDAVDNSSGFFKKSSKEYSGHTIGNTFEIKRNIYYKNSFLPAIKGTITTEGTETLIRVKMRMHPFIYVFVGFWCSGVTVALIAIIFNCITTATFSSVIFFPFGMLAFCYALVMIGFKSESSRSIEDLKKIFKAK